MTLRDVLSFLSSGFLVFSCCCLLHYENLLLLGYYLSNLRLRFFRIGSEPHRDPKHPRLHWGSSYEKL